MGVGVLRGQGTGLRPRDGTFGCIWERGQIGWVLWVCSPFPLLPGTLGEEGDPSSLSPPRLTSPPAFQQSSHKKKKTEFIPYRDSVLTWLLKENLGE